MSMIFGVFSALFSVVNPLGAIPIFLSLTHDNSNKERNQQALKACVYAACILIAFLLSGTYILNFFGITIEGMKIAGGFIIMRTGYNLLSATYRRGKAINERVEEEAVEKEDISFSPLAMPMLSGPGSISLLISMGMETNTWVHYGYIIISILLLAGATYVILRSSPLLFKLLGQGGISAMSRIMGFIVMTIGIQFIINGVMPLLKELVQG